MTNEETTMNALEAVSAERAIASSMRPMAEMVEIQRRRDIGIDLEAMKEIANIAVLFSKSQLVADCYRGEQGRANAFVALSLGFELGIAPFMALNQIVVVKGRPSMQGQLAIALINQRAPIKGTVMYNEGGEGDAQFCEAYCIDRNTGERLSYKITIKDAKDAGWLAGSFSLWNKMPKLMLRYRAASYLARSHYPGVMMGLMTTEEVEDVHKVSALEEDTAARKELGLDKKASK